MVRVLRWTITPPPLDRCRYRIRRWLDPRAATAFGDKGNWTRIVLVCENLWAGFTVGELTRDQFRRWHRTCWEKAKGMSTPLREEVATEYYHRTFDEILERMNEMGFWLDEKLPDPSGYELDAHERRRRKRLRRGWSIANPADLVEARTFLTALPECPSGEA